CVAVAHSSALRCLQVPRQTMSRTVTVAVSSNTRTETSARSFAFLMGEEITLPGVVKDDPKRVPVAAADPAHPVPEINAIHAASAADRTMVDRKNDPVTLPQRHDLSPGLHPRPLLREDELATREVLLRLGQQNGYLKRKDELAVE